MCTLQRPFNNPREIISIETPDLPDRYSKDLNSLFKRILDKTPETRISINEIIDYFQTKYNISISTILNKKNLQMQVSTSETELIYMSLFAHGLDCQPIG